MEVPTLVEVPACNFRLRPKDKTMNYRKTESLSDEVCRRELGRNKIIQKYRFMKNCWIQRWHLFSPYTACKSHVPKCLPGLLPGHVVQWKWSCPQLPATPINSTLWWRFEISFLGLEGLREFKRNWLYLTLFALLSFLVHTCAKVQISLFH